MPIDPAVVGTELAPVTMEIERGRLRQFAKAIGETDPIYIDVAAAWAAGHPDLVVPPTFLVAVGNERPEPFDWLADIGIDLNRVLHGEQSITYHRMAHAGERVTARPRIVDLRSKRGGAMEILVRETTVVGADGTVIAELGDSVIVREEVAA